MLPFNSQKLTLEEYLAQDVHIPEKDSLKERAEQYLKYQIKKNDHAAFFERLGLKQFNMHAIIFKMQDIRSFAKIITTKKIVEYLEASPSNCDNLRLISKITKDKLEYIQPKNGA